MVDVFWPLQPPMHPTQCRVAGAVPLPHIAEQLPAALHAVHALLLPDVHVWVRLSGPSTPAHPSAVRLRVCWPWPQSTEQLLHPLHALNPLDPHCCVAVTGPPKHDAPHVPVTHIRLLCCVPSIPHDTLHADHADHDVK